MSPVPSRLASVDVFRGATMAAMVIVNTPGDWDHVYWPLLHAEWHGWTPTDLIFPFFVFIVGVSIVLSKKSTAALGPIVRRAAVIFGLGLLLALYPRFDFTTVRIMGVLARLAICYLAAVLIYRAVAARDERTRVSALLIIAAVLLVFYWFLLTFVPVPGGHAGDLSPSGNLGAWIDRTVLGEAHLWRQSKTWDPEGLLSTVPAIATALTGVVAGLVLVTGRGDFVPAEPPLRAHSRGLTRLRSFAANRDPTNRAAILVLAGAASTVVGRFWGVTFPINKNLWTSSYVLFTSGLASILLALCYWLVDLRQYRRFARPFTVMGVNALVLFVVSGWLVKTLLLVKATEPTGQAVTLYRWIYAHVFEPLASPKSASLMFAVAALLVLYAMLEVLYRRRWFVRA